MSNLRYGLVSNIIFEVDGVIFDTEKINSAAIEAITSKRYMPINPNKLHDLFGRSDTETIRMVIEETGINASSFEGLLYDYREYCRKQMPYCQTLPGVTRLIKHLYSQNFPLAIATTNRFHAFQDKARNHRDIIDLFHHIVYAPDDYEVRSATKAKDLYQVCAKRFEGQPSCSRCLVFDSTKEGVLGARQARMQVVWVTSPNSAEPKMNRKATVCIKSLEFFKPDHFGLPPYCKCDTKE